MAQATYHFPRGFLWGTATASHQVEGKNTNNNWWRWEQEPGRIKDGASSGLACDWWGGRWREDLDRAAEHGQNAHRLSIEWSRVQPTAGRWDEDALDYYRQIVRGVVERGMTPLVTLHHFSDPLWFTEMGGWTGEDASALFEPYVAKVVTALKEYVSLWVTINEPNVFAVSGYLFGDFPPGLTNPAKAWRVMINLVRAHAAAYHTIHDIQTTARVGLAHNYHCMKPRSSSSLLDRWAASMGRLIFNHLIPVGCSSGVLRFPVWHTRIPQARNTQDFFGLNYYTRELISLDLLKPGQAFVRRSYHEDDQLSDTGFIANVPEGMFEALKWAESFRLPIIITENGIENARDDLRPRYILGHLHQVWRALNFNYPIKGYFHWTLVDNFEWERGWTQRFGLWELDIETQARSKRASADLYAEICNQNAISSSLVAKYAPELLKSMFPG